jgi:hypothetical protein
MEVQYEGIIGIPKGRSLPLAFGMYTRLAGLARQGCKVIKRSTN